MPASPPPVRPAEAIAWFESRVPISADTLLAIRAAAGKKAFTIAQAAQQSVVDDVHEALVRALEEGTTIEDFRAAVEDKLTRAWAGSVQAPAARVETIFRTEVQGAYNAGRVAQASDPDTLALRPFWRFVAISDHRTSAICKAAAGTVLRHDDPWWQTHTPPLHPNCFPAGTFVTTSRGPVPIEQVEPGALVLTHRGRFRRVLARFKTPRLQPLVEVRLASGGKLVGTPNHPALTRRGWVVLARLRPGDRLVKVCPVPVLGEQIEEGQGLEPGMSEGAQAIDWHAVEALGNLDDEAERGHEEVCEIEMVLDDQRGLEGCFQSEPGEPLGNQSLAAGRLGTALGMSARVLQVVPDASLGGLCHDLGAEEPLPARKLGSGAGEPRVGVLGVARGPGLPSGADLLEPGALLLSALLGGLGPLVEDSLRPSPDRDAVQLQDPPDGPHTLGPQQRGHLPKRELLREVEVCQVGGGVRDSGRLHADFETMVRHADEYASALETVEGIRTVSSDESHVFNLSVEDDESYVAGGYIVHNCRCSFDTLTEAQAARYGVTAQPSTAPEHQPSQGFGQRPEVP